MQEEMDVQAREEREAAERHGGPMRTPSRRCHFRRARHASAVCRERTERERAMAEEAERLTRLSLHIRHRSVLNLLSLRAPSLQSE